jgi:hypothetical protein
VFKYCLTENDIDDYNIDIKNVIQEIKENMNNSKSKDDMLKAIQNKPYCSSMMICILNKYKADILNIKNNSNIFTDILASVYESIKQSGFANKSKPISSNQDKKVKEIISDEKLEDKLDNKSKQVDIVKTMSKEQDNKSKQIDIVNQTPIKTDNKSKQIDIAKTTSKEQDNKSEKTEIKTDDKIKNKIKSNKKDSKTQNLFDF